MKGVIDMKMRKMLGKGGFTLVEIMIVVAIIGLLAAIAIPNFVRTRERAQEQACVANMRQMQGAKTLWALDNNQGNNAVPTMAQIVPDYIQNTPTCPAGGAYTLNSVIAMVNCGTHGDLDM